MSDQTTYYDTVEPDLWSTKPVESFTPRPNANFGHSLRGDAPAE